jgi:hypothetical protein
MKMAYALGASVSVFAATATFAGPGSTATPSASPVSSAEPTPIMVEGTVASTDPASKAIVLVVGKRKLTFQTSYLVPIRDGRLLEFRDLKAGLKVEGCAVLEDGHLVLKTLTVY